MLGEKQTFFVEYFIYAFPNIKKNCQIEARSLDEVKDIFYRKFQLAYIDKIQTTSDISNGIADLLLNDIKKQLKITDNEN